MISSHERELVRLTAEAHEMVVTQSAFREGADHLLEGYVALLGGDYGFIGYRRLDDSGAPYLHTIALSDIAWNEATAERYAEHLARGLEFRNLSTLFGLVLREQRLLIADDAASHPSAGGIPEGHPPLTRFLGIPVHSDGAMVAMVGIANFSGNLTHRELEETALLIDRLTAMVLATAEINASRDRLLDTRSRSRLRMFEQVLGGFAHELNNELMVLTQGAAMLAGPSGLGAAELREVAREVRGAGQAIADLVSDLQRFERVASDEPDEIEGVLHALLHSTARIASLITLLPCELDDASLPPEVRLALPASLAMSWLLEAALLVSDATRSPRPARISTLGPHLDAASGEEVLSILVTSATTRPVARDGFVALRGECEAWGVRLASLPDGLRMELPTIADGRAATGS